MWSHCQLGYCSKFLVNLHTKQAHRKQRFLFFFHLSLHRTDKTTLFTAVKRTKQYNSKSTTDFPFTAYFLFKMLKYWFFSMSKMALFGSVIVSTPVLTCDQALFSFRSVKHSGGTGETKNRA